MEQIEYKINNPEYKKSRIPFFIKGEEGIFIKFKFLKSFRY